MTSTSLTAPWPSCVSASRSRQRLRWLGPPVLHAAKTALASGLSWYLAADVLGNTIPVFAPLAALLTVQVTVWESVSRGLQRVVGVFVGVLVSFFFARLVGIHWWSVALIVFVALLAGQALRLGPQGSVQVPVSALLVLVLGATTGGYAVDRVVDTALGVAVGILVNLVLVPPTQLAQAQAEVRLFGASLADLLRQVASGVAAAPSPSAAAPAEVLATGPAMAPELRRARQLSDEAAAAAAAVENTALAARWNPSGRRYGPAISRLAWAMGTLKLIERPVRGIARAFSDARPAGRFPPDLGAALADLLGSVADQLDAWAAWATTWPRPDDSGPVPSPGAADAYRRALVASRSPDLDLELAAVAATVAIDAHRISTELPAHHQAPPLVGPTGWRALLGP